MRTKEKIWKSLSKFLSMLSEDERLPQFDRSKIGSVIEKAEQRGNTDQGDENFIALAVRKILTITSGWRE